MRKEEVSKNDDHTLSVIYANLKTVKDCLPDVKAERPTIGIEYHLQLIKKALDELAATGRHDKLILKQRRRFDRLSKRALKVVGDKKRVDSIYG